MSRDSCNEELKLAQEYRYLLSHIRPLIGHLVNSRDAQLCLLWLSRLDECSRLERLERNAILYKLCEQVKKNHLQPPFNSPPPSGPLGNILITIASPSSWKSKDCSDMEGDVISEGSMSCSVTTHNTPRFSSSKAINDQLHSSWRKSNLSPTANSENSTRVLGEFDHSECVALRKAYEERFNNDQTLIQRFQEIIKSLISQQLMNVDNSPSKAKKLKEMYEGRIAVLNACLNVAEDEKESLKIKVQNHKFDIQELNTLKTQNEALQTKIVTLETARDQLEMKCKDLETDKTEVLSEITRKWNESEEIVKKSENKVNSLEKQLKEDLEKNRLEHKKEIDERERIHSLKLSELASKLKEKEKEIEDLKEQMKDQCHHFQQQISRLKEHLLQNSDVKKEKRKVKWLKTKTKELEKIQENMAAAFQVELQHVIAKRDLHIATLEMKLKANRCEQEVDIVNSEVNQILNQKISALEHQYRLLLEESEVQAAKRRQMDLQKIHNLEKHLLTSGKAISESKIKLSSPRSGE